MRLISGISVIILGTALLVWLPLVWMLPTGWLFIIIGLDILHD